MDPTAATEEPTRVVFRVWKSKRPQDREVIALFPDIDEGRGLCSSYMHVGQHGSASYTGVIETTRPATPDEYRALKRELESAPYNYNLAVRQRR